MRLIVLRVKLTCVLQLDSLTSVVSYSRSQIYGIQLIPDLTDMERHEAVEELKAAFAKILGDHEASASAAGDGDFVDLLMEVGKKLNGMRLTGCSEVKTEEEEDISLDKCVDIVDPIEKVEKWKLESQNNNEEDKPQNVTTTSSCYGSLPTSPSPPSAGVKPKAPHSPPAEFDSGYPGSDRSGFKFYSLRGLSPGNNSQAKSNQRFLFNLEEEDRSQHSKGLHPEEDASDSSSLPSDFQPPQTSERRKASPQQQQQQQQQQLLKPPNLHRTYLHSVTDLSSDERSMVEERRRQEEMNQNQPVLTSTPVKEVPLQQLQPQQQQQQQITPRSELSSGRQPVILAKQIDHEINELRNFFDDHREEMLTLLNDNSQELFPDQPPQNFPLPQPPQKSSLKSTNSFDSATEFGDIQQERKMEFERRRKSRNRRHNKMISSSPSVLAYSDQEQIQIQPDFALGADTNDPDEYGAGPKAGISALFPPVVPHGRQIEADRGPIFVPRLNLEDVWTDEEKRDPRSFDFHQSSLLSCQSIAEEDEHSNQDQEVEKIPERTSRRDSACQTSSMEKQQQQLSEPVVVVQACCHGSSSGPLKSSSSRRSSTSERSKRRKEKSKAQKVPYIRLLNL